MSTFEETLSWTGVPLPDALRGVPAESQQAVADYLKAVVDLKTDGFDELYHAIGTIVRYIPHFIVIPLMVEHIRPRIAAGVCRTMGVEQATHYANDLPVEYFSEVSKHLDDRLMAEIFEKMKKHHAEKVIRHELNNHLNHLLGIAGHLDDRMLAVVARMVALPEKQEELAGHPHQAVIEKIRALQ
jgi:hypothetical protein